MRRAAPALLLAAVLALSACGGGDSSSSSGDSGGGSGGSGGGGYGSMSPPASSSGGGASTVTMKGFAFSPKKATVKVGQTVTWKNADSAAHNVTAQSGADFKSDNFAKGGSFAFKPTKAGTITYECTLHPGMTGELDVTS